MFPRKIYIRPTTFVHHRSGWEPISKALYDNLFSANGITLYDWADKIFKDNNVIEHPWLGVFHNVIRYPTEYQRKYSGRIYPLNRLVQQPHFLKSLKHCKGMFTLSEHTAKFLRKYTKKDVVSLVHSILPVRKNFLMQNYQSRVVTVGQWLRRYHSICELPTTMEKILLKTAGFKEDYDEMMQYSRCHKVNFLNYLDIAAYDDLLASSAVFLDMYDLAACNVILECIIRNTPILINKLPAAVEYLGNDYPLFYSDLNDAVNKLNKIEEGHLYLKSMDKTKFTIDAFLDSLTDSNIYQELK